MAIKPGPGDWGYVPSTPLDFESMSITAPSWPWCGDASSADLPEVDVARLTDEVRQELRTLIREELRAALAEERVRADIARVQAFVNRDAESRFIPAD